MIYLRLFKEVLLKDGMKMISLRIAGSIVQKINARDMGSKVIL